MTDNHRGHRSRIDGSNVPGNPLRSYRMSMLAHGFVDTGDGDTFDLDETDPVSYSVVRLRAHPLTAAAVIVLAVLVIAIVSAIMLAT